MGRKQKYIWFILYDGCTLAMEKDGTLKKKRKNKKEEFGNYVMEQQLQELS